MKIKGVDGLAPADVRGEIDRGARFVMYSYCVSLLVVTLKRPSSIYLVKPGQSRLTMGLPWTLLSVIAGWWGIPWGPIYTIESLIKNFSGGTDMTDEVMAAIAPDTTPRDDAPRPDTSKKIALTTHQKLLGVAAVAAVLLLGYAAWCDNAGKHPFILLSGLPTPYTIELNGKPVELPPFGLVRLERPEGEYTLKGCPDGGTETFRIATPFWSRPFNEQVVVINPDRVAPFAQREVVYSSGPATADANAEPVFTLHVNQRVSVLPKPAYLFETPPANIRMSSHNNIEKRTAVTVLENLSLARTHEIISAKLGDEAARRYVENLLTVRSDEKTVSLAAEVLKPAEALVLLEKRFADRPVAVEVHRFYQHLSQQLHPNTDLVAKYTRLVEADPQNGDLLYLLGRVVRDDVRARELYRSAISAPRPSAYGHVGLGAGCAAAADFDDAARHYRLAMDGGVQNQQVQAAYHQSLLALGRYDELLGHLRRLRAPQPANIDLAAMELRAEMLKGADNDRVQLLINAYCTNIASDAAKERAYSRSFLEAQAAGARGDEQAFAQKISQLPGPLFVFQSAICRSDCEAAAGALSGQPAPVRFHLAIYLAALRAGKSEAAQQAWKAALNAIPNDNKAYGDVLRFVADPAAIQPQALCHSMLSPDDKRVLLAALGLRFPQHRVLFHQYAARFNTSPDFPQLLVKAALQIPPTAAR